MRRKDREVSDKEKIRRIISECYCCRLGFNDNGEIYIIPLNFGFDFKDERLTFYFHGAKEGRKIDLIKKTTSVGFELDTNYRLEKGNIACEYTAGFQSIIGNGRNMPYRRKRRKKGRFTSDNGTLHTKKRLEIFRTIFKFRGRFQIRSERIIMQRTFVNSIKIFFVNTKKYYLATFQPSLNIF